MFANLTSKNKSNISENQHKQWNKLEKNKDYRNQLNERKQNVLGIVNKRITVNDILNKKEINDDIDVHSLDNKN